MSSVTATSLLEELRRLGIRITTRDGQLELRSGGTPLPEALRQQLVLHKAELLELLAPAPTRAQPTSGPADTGPLSFAQQRMWFVDQLEGPSAAFNSSLRLDIRGALDIPALIAGIDALVARHDVLRTTIEMDGEFPRQRVHPPGAAMGQVIDLRHLETGARDAVVDHHVREEAGRTFDLGHDVWFRYRLLIVADDAWVLMLTSHHIAGDAWSLSVIVRDLSALYAAQLHGRPEVLPSLPLRYVDFARWQRDNVPDHQIEYWKRTLEEPLPRSLPPLFQPPPDHPDYRGDLVSRALPHDLAAAIRELAGTTQTSPFMVLATALAFLLSRHGDQDDVVIGMPLAGRNRVEFEGMVGCFLNQVPLRIAVSGRETGRDLLLRVRDVTLAALAHQDVPFERIVEGLDHDRASSRNPAFEVMLNVINTPVLEIGLEGTTTVAVEQGTSWAKYPLTVHAHEDRGTLTLAIGYQTALFTRLLIETFQDQLECILRALTHDPASALEDVSLLTARSARLTADLRMALPPSPAPGIVETIREWAERTPDRIAVQQGADHLSYASLLSHSELLAQAMLAAGLVPGDTVAIDGRRSPGLIVAMVAVWRAGGVFLNLDPHHPPARRHLMVERARTRLVLALGRGGGPSGTGVRRLAVDPRSGLPIHPVADMAPLPTVDPDADAYIFFTSGSTGEPKAVLGWHGALAHFCHWFRSALELGPNDRVSQLAGLSFDGLLKDVFPTLTAGATLCLPNELEAEDGPQLLQWLEDARITVANTVPSRAQTWLHDIPPRVRLESLRWFTLAGEPLRSQLVEAWQHHFPAPRLLNFYGATEITVLNCFYQVPRPPQPGMQPVGRARPDTQIAVVRPNRLGIVCGIGEIGEVVLRTRVSTRGYLGDPRLTSARFVSNPHSADREDQLYRTGDRGRLRPDGEVEVLGRVDDQVKVRGLRVELGEVRSSLSRHPAVAECVVVHRHDESHDDLVAYVVPRGGASFDPQSLRAHLTGLLPAPMVPGVFVEIAAIPLTANGKVDRAKLPPPVAQPTRDLSAPATPTERFLADLWAELLNVPSISRTDSFFDLGGHSLLATRIVSRIRSTYGVTVGIRSFFLDPTVAALAAAIDGLLSARQQLTETPELTASAADRDGGVL